jgi:hypothetical protein
MEAGEIPRWNVTNIWSGKLVLKPSKVLMAIVYFSMNSLQYQTMHSYYQYLFCDSY